MKRALALALCLLTPLLFFTPAASAVEPETAVTEVLEAGDCLVSGIGEPILEEINDEATVTTFADLLRFFKRLWYFFTGVKTVEKSKYLRYYDQNGVLLWEAVLTAEFAYSQKQVRCESAKLSFVSLDRDWSLVSRQTEKDGGMVRGTVSVRQTKLGVPLQTLTRTLTLTCDANGNVQ